MPRVLLIEDDEDVANATVGLLAAPSAGEEPLAVEWANGLQKGLACLAESEIQAVLLDLNLPDSQGLETFLAVNTSSPELPIVILTALDDMRVALEAVRLGAQDYLVKGRFDAATLSRAVRYAVERNRLQQTIRSMALIDPLTGLYSRGAFRMLADQQLKLAQRAQRRLLLFCADVDGLKAINDRWGHPAGGDQALKEAASALRQTFRRSDVVARIGGDEFAVLAIEVREDAEPILRSRLQERLLQLNAQPNRSWSLSLSIGAAVFDPASPCSLDDLLTEADKALYDQRRRKRLQA